MPRQRAGRSKGWSTGQKRALWIIGALAALVFVPPLIAACVSAAGPSVGGPPPSGHSTGPAASPTASSHTVAVAHPNPTFRYPGDPECAITYGSAGSGSMTWTSNVTVTGTLRTHAGDTAGDLYPYTAHVTPGANGFVAPQPLWKIDDIGGVLYAADGKSYACSIAPAG
jgi:hypothetical protein